MKPTHEAQNPMVYGTHRRTPFTNNTMSQAYAVPECTATRRGTSGRTSSRCSTESARCVLLQRRMLPAPTRTNRQGCERADAGRDWFLRQAGWWRSWQSQYRVSPRRGPVTLFEEGRSVSLYTRNEHTKRVFGGLEQRSRSGVFVLEKIFWSTACSGVRKSEANKR